jgi:protoporphyrin/coproporphyrin ferrochelatase
VLTPSFVADCLETLEEIGMRLREQWEGIGGEDLLLVPCVNASPVWADALVEMIRRPHHLGSDGNKQPVGGERAHPDALSVD